MKKHICIIVVIGVLAWLMPSLSMAQDDYLTSEVAEQLDGYYKELQKMDKQIVTAEDAENTEPQYKRHIKYVETIYNAYSELISYEKKLRTLYENYNDLYLRLGKRIEQLKQEKADQERFDKESAKLDRYLEQLTSLEAAANRCVEKKNNDSLDIYKKQAQDCKNEANQEYGANREFIDDNETLSQTWQQIKDIGTKIEALKVEEEKSPIDMTLILEIVGVLAAVALIINMISTKVKAAKLLRQQTQKDKPKPKDPEIPSI